MKTLFAISLFLFFSCSDVPVKPVDSKHLSGIWVPYEIKYSDGTVANGPFTASSIFGIYAESVQFKNDNTYIPVIWNDSNNYQFKTEEAGIFEYSQDDKLLFTEGFANMEFEITKIENDDMWLTHTGDIALLGDKTLYKLKRQVD